MTADAYPLLDAIQKWLPLAISFLALAVTATFSWMSQADRRQAARLAREKDLHSWARDIGEIFVSLRAGNEDDRKRAAIRLSVLIDYGRLFFPNERSARAIKEHHKGRRSSVLDPLVEAFERCSLENWDEVKLAEDWREFTDQLNIRSTAFAVDTSPEAEGRKQYRNP